LLSVTQAQSSGLVGETKTLATRREGKSSYFFAAAWSWQPTGYARKNKN